MGNLSALLFTCLSYLLPLLSPTLRRNSTALWLAWASLTLRHAVAIVNAFVTPILASWGDIYRFHNIGAGISDEPQNFGMLLRVVYKAFGTSFWLGEEVSIIAFSLCIALFAEISRQLNVQNKLAPCMALFALLPSPMIHTSVILREPLQMLGFLGMTCALFSLREKPRGASFALLVLALATLVFMHQGLVVYVAAVMGLALPWALQGLKGSDRGSLQGLLLLGSLLFAPMVLPKFISAFESESHVAHAITQGKLLEYTASYRVEVREARSDYGIELQTDSVFSFAATATVAIAMFFIAPLPWQASSALDYYAFGEVCLRIMLFYGSYKAIQQARGEPRARLLCLMALCLSLDVLWALGTTNWGTSLRHHVVAYGGFVLLGVPYLANFTLDPQLAALQRRREENRRRAGTSAIQNDPPELRTLLLLARANFRPFLVLCTVLGLLIFWRTRPESSPATQSVAPYISRASLLLPAGARFSFNSIIASTGRSDLDFWLANEVLFEKLMAKQQVYRKLEKALQPKYPDLVSLAATVQVLPVRLYYYEETFDTQEEVVINPFLAGLQSVGQSNTIERDYAQIYLDEVKALGRYRVSRIIVQAGANRPEDSKILASYMVSVLQKELVEVAVRKARARRKMVERYMKLGARKIAASNRRLQQSKGIDPAHFFQQLQERQELESHCRRLRQEITSLRVSLKLESPTQVESPITDELEKLRQAYHQSSLLFLPDSQTLRQLGQRMASIQKLLTQDTANRQAAFQLPQLASLKAKEQLLSESENRLDALRRVLPSQKVQRTTAQIFREIEAWETEQMQWEEQLLEVRIEERLCQGDGTAVLLQSPLAGIRARQGTQKFRTRYAKTLKYLPFAPLLAGLALALIHIIKTSNRLTLRVESMLDAPVLAELQGLPHRSKFDS